MAIASFVSRAHSRERVQINSQGRHWFDFRRSCVGRATGEMKKPDCGPVPQRTRPGDRPRPSVADRAGAPSIAKAGNARPAGPRLLPRTVADGDAHRSRCKAGRPINRAIREPSLRDCAPRPRQPGSVRLEDLQRASEVTGSPPVPWDCNPASSDPHRFPCQARSCRSACDPQDPQGNGAGFNRFPPGGSESRATCSSALRQALQLRPSRRMKSRTLP